MATTVGSGNLLFEPVEMGKLPPGWEFIDVAGLPSTQDNVCLQPGEHPVVVFDRDGNFLRSLARQFSDRPHGVHISRTNPFTAWTTGYTPSRSSAWTASCS
jgi:hypothetical protein